MTKNQQQEALSRAYIQTVAAKCGMSYSIPNPDFGIDLTLNDLVARGPRRMESGFRLDIQAKSTTLASVEPTGIKYDLDIQAYDDLRVSDPPCPRLLVVHVLPDNEEDWLQQTEEGLTLSRCAYWLSLRGWEPSANKRSLRLLIPRDQVFSVEHLRAIMTRIKGGGLP